MQDHSRASLIDADQWMQQPGPAPADSPAAARGRRIFSAAFVRIGADGHLTVKLHDGRTLILRDVVMGSGKFCGKPASGGPGHKFYCGSYGDIAAAHPGGAPVSQFPNDAGPLPAASISDKGRVERE